MGIINRFKIRTRLFIAMAVALVAIVVITAYSFNTTNKVGDTINTINSHPLIVSNAAADSQHLVLDILKTYQDAFIEKDITKRKIFEKKIIDYEKNLDSNMETIQQLILGDEGQKLAKETSSNIAKWRVNNYNLMDKIFDLNNREIARAYMSTTELEEVEGIQIQLNAIQTYAKNKAESLEVQAIDIQKKAKVTTIDMCFVAIFILLVLCL